jgi:hypothetical protein
LFCIVAKKKQEREKNYQSGFRWSLKSVLLPPWCRPLSEGINATQGIIRSRGGRLAGRECTTICPPSSSSLLFSPLFWELCVWFIVWLVRERVYYLEPRACFFFLACGLVWL